MNAQENLTQSLRVAVDPSAAVGPDDEAEHCPWCNSLISRAQYLQIRAKIAEQERKRLNEEKLRIEEEFKREKEAFQARLEEEVAAKLAGLATERDQAEARIRAEAEEKLVVVSAERDQAATRLRELQEKEAALREQAVAEAEARVRAEAEEKLTAVSAERDQAATRLRELQEKEAALREQAVAEAEARVRAEAEEKLAAVSAERDQAATRLRELQEKEAALREQAVAEAEARVRAEAEEKLAAVSAERDQAATRLRELQEKEAALREQAVAEAEARVRVEAEEKLAAVSTERDQAATQLRETEAQYQKDLSQLRHALEQDRDLQLAKLASQHTVEREQLLEKVSTLTKQLEHKNASELSEGAALDICEVLRDHFESDNISRIHKGRPGADIIHNVIHNNLECGSIIFDSKNRQAWRDSYLEKLRADQVAAKAEHAVLVTNFFPQGKKELYIDPATGIIVVSHARVIEIVNVVRSFMVQLHRQGLSLEQRTEKKDRLYEYLTSEDYRQNIAEASRLSKEIAELDVEEKKVHDKVWEKRGSLQRKLHSAIRHIDTEVNAVLDGKQDSQASS